MRGRAFHPQAEEGREEGSILGVRCTRWQGLEPVQNSEIPIPSGPSGSLEKLDPAIQGHQGLWVRACRLPRAHAANHKGRASKAVAPVAGSGTATGGHGESSKRFEWNRIEFFRAFALGKSVSTC